ncbi:MAG: hypothetical protein SF187_18535 [Deltaproteobacteria bacterium]|nr:hypothetical protein [Deltaproteobacteria bacterium]
MENIERAIATSQSLHKALGEEVARAQTQRELIKNFDSQALLERAALRGRFNNQVKHLQAQLADALKAVAQEYDMPVVTIEALGRLMAEPTDRLAASLAEVRALAGTLKELDALNRHLASRANAMVKGYLGALTGSSTTYNHRGESRPLAGSTYSGTA